MEIIKLTFNDFYENTYILFDHTKECIIVDPGNSNASEDKELFDTIEKHKLTPVLLINTHCHLDHVFGNGVVAEKYGLTPKRFFRCLKRQDIHLEVYVYMMKKVKQL